VIEGRENVIQEIAESPLELREYCADASRRFLAKSKFRDVLPGFVLQDERVPLIEKWLAAIGELFKTIEN